MDVNSANNAIKQRRMQPHRLALRGARRTSLCYNLSSSVVPLSVPTPNAINLTSQTKEGKSSGDPGGHRHLSEAYLFILRFVTLFMCHPAVITGEKYEDYISNSLLSTPMKLGRTRKEVRFRCTLGYISTILSHLEQCQRGTATFCQCRN